MMSAPFGGAPTLPFNTANTPRAGAAPRRRRNLRRAREAHAAAQALPALLPDARGEREHVASRRRGIHAFLRAYYHMKSADWKQNQPASARRAHRRRVGEAAALLRHGSRQGHGRAGGAGDAVGRRDRRQQVAARFRAARLRARNTAAPASRAGSTAIAAAPGDTSTCSSSPARRSMCRRCSWAARATGACIRTPVRSSGCEKTADDQVSRHASGRRRRPLGAAGAARGVEQAPARIPEGRRN